ncbi:hypothetical protein FIC_01411 [Flavobacteriaceae bacterium 3519-10]|nr:hypothetical protein FIC_01411 [Flavobacteriaceae bacterium 3519-10]
MDGSVVSWHYARKSEQGQKGIGEEEFSAIMKKKELK